jgi:hypothetical protein
MNNIYDEINDTLLQLMSDDYQQKEIIQNELMKYYNLLNNDLELLSNKDTEEYITFNDFIQIVQRSNIKSIHFNEYKSYPKPILFVMKNIFLLSFTLLLRLIHLLNANPALMTKNRTMYSQLLNNFVSKVPCYEEYTRTLQGYLTIVNKQMEPIEETNANNNNISEHMSISDFHNDGGFAHYFNPIFQLHQTILLSLLSFQQSVCNSSSKACVGYNTANYKTFLEYIHFFKNPTYKTTTMDWNELVEYFTHNQIELPDSSNIDPSSKDALRERQENILIGGVKKRPANKRARAITRAITIVNRKSRKSRKSRKTYRRNGRKTYKRKYDKSY